MKDKVDIIEILTNRDQQQIIDVRSPGEYLSGHIPGALNIPLFSDEERVRVGTLYKQVSPAAAMKEGLGIASSKMNQYLEAVRSNLREHNEQVIIHCWRGGKRSEAMHWLLT